MLTALIAGIFTLSAASVNALTEAQTAMVKKAFDNIPAAELSAKAAQMVAQTAARDKEEVAVTITQTILKKHPAVAVSLVSAISKVAPEVASTVAATAAKIVNAYAEAIAVAAAKAAPQFSEEIAQAVITAAPKNSSAVLTKVRASTRMANKAVAAASAPVIRGGPIRGPQFTPIVPPSPVAAPPVEGFDPNRYSAP